MNAFMALKNTDQEKDVKWIQNFLSESLVEDIPWECSKALIILKEGYQAIIPREASRSILLGNFTDRIIALYVTLGKYKCNKNLGKTHKKRRHVLK